MFDLVIKGASVVDGTGAAARRADVAVRGERIAEVGSVSGHAGETVDADGLTLAPGFIDIHTHYDAQATWDPTCSPSPSLGVTTVVMGNCGFGIVPCPETARETMIGNLSVVEGMDLDALRAGISWDFETFPQYMDSLRRSGSYPNVAAFIGHSAVRTAVMGTEASLRAAPTEAEMTAMRACVSEALDAGAIGFASSYSPNHVGVGGVPMPSTVSAESEMMDLAGILKDKGRGVCQVASGARITVDMMEDLAAATGRPMFMTTTLAMYNEALPDKSRDMLAACAGAVSRGHEVYAQITCQPLSFDFTPANAYPFYSHSAFADVKGADRDGLKRAFADADFRERFRRDLAAPKPGVMFWGTWDRVEITVPALAKNAGLSNRSVADVAAERGADPVDVFFDLALEEDLQTVVIARLLNVDEDGVAPLLKHHAGVVGLSDAGAHLIYMCDAGFALHLLSKWVRERADFTLEEGVRRLTSHPADLYRIPARGRITPGAFADMVLFDPHTVGISAPKRIADLPAGGTRTIREPRGVAAIWVNGCRVFDGSGYVEMAQGPGHVLDNFDA